MSASVQPQTKWDAGVESYRAFAKFTGAFAEETARRAVADLIARLDAAGEALGRDAGSAIRVLDIAAGTGASTLALIEALAARLGNDVHAVVTATDVSPGMLAELEKAWGDGGRGAAFPNVTLETRVHDMQAEDVKVAAASQHVVAMIFGLMFPERPVDALKELRRVLHPRCGVAAVTTWHQTSQFEMVREVAAAQGRVAAADYNLPFLKFGQEPLVTQLLREADIRVVSPFAPTATKTSDPAAALMFLQLPPMPFPIAALLGRMETSPVYSVYAPYDLAAAETLLRERFGTPEDSGIAMVHGTALLALIR